MEKKSAHRQEKGQGGILLYPITVPRGKVGEGFCTWARGSKAAFIITSKLSIGDKL